MPTIRQLRPDVPTAANHKIAARLIAEGERLTAELVAGRVSEAAYERRMLAQARRESEAEARSPAVRRLLVEHVTRRFWETVDALPDGGAAWLEQCRRGR